MVIHTSASSGFSNGFRILTAFIEFKTERVIAKYVNSTKNYQPEIEKNIHNFDCTPFAILVIDKNQLSVLFMVTKKKDLELISRQVKVRLGLINFLSDYIDQNYLQ